MFEEFMQLLPWYSWDYRSLVGRWRHAKTSFVGPRSARKRLAKDVDDFISKKMRAQVSGRLADVSLHLPQRYGMDGFVEGKVSWRCLLERTI